MLIRVATFSVPLDGRDWVTESLRGVPGVRAVYHANRPGTEGYISVSVLDDEAASQAAWNAIAARREELRVIELEGPDTIEFYVVDHYVENQWRRSS